MLARKGFRREDIEAARGRLEEAQGHVAELDARLREAELNAPADAVVEVVSVRPGDLVPAGTDRDHDAGGVAALGRRCMCRRRSWRIVRVGQRAAVEVDSFGGRLRGARGADRITSRISAAQRADARATASTKCSV